jgi:hypothetical protein
VATNGHPPNGTNGHRKKTPAQEVIDLAHQLDKAHAERDSALAACLALREAFCSSGGYMTPVQQIVLRDIESMLVDRGLLKPFHERRLTKRA